MKREDLKPGKVNSKDKAKFVKEFATLAENLNTLHGALDIEDGKAAVRKVQHLGNKLIIAFGQKEVKIASAPALAVIAPKKVGTAAEIKKAKKEAEAAAEAHAEAAAILAEKTEAAKAVAKELADAQAAHVAAEAAKTKAESVIPVKK